MTAKFDLQFDDMRMSEELQVLNLASDFSHDIQVFDLLSVEDFDSNFMSSQLMFGR